MISLPCQIGCSDRHNSPNPCANKFNDSVAPLLQNICSAVAALINCATSFLADSYASVTLAAN